MQTQPNFQQLLDQFVANLNKQAEAARAVVDSTDPDWDLYYADVAAQAAAAKTYFDSRVAMQRAIL